MAGSGRDGRLLVAGTRVRVGVGPSPGATNSTFAEEAYYDVPVCEESKCCVCGLIVLFMPDTDGIFACYACDHHRCGGCREYDSDGHSILSDDQDHRPPHHRSHDDEADEAAAILRKPRWKLYLSSTLDDRN